MKLNILKYKRKLSSDCTSKKYQFSILWVPGPGCKPWNNNLWICVHYHFPGSSTRWKTAGNCWNSYGLQNIMAFWINCWAISSFKNKTPDSNFKASNIGLFYYPLSSHRTEVNTPRNTKQHFLEVSLKPFKKDRIHPSSSSYLYLDSTFFYWHTCENM